MSSALHACSVADMQHSSTFSLAPFYVRKNAFWKKFVVLFYVVQVLSKLYICKDITYHYYLRPNSIVTGATKSSLGKSFCIIHDEILNHLMPGGEAAELNYYVEGFYRFYLEHKATIQEFFVYRVSG